MSKRSIKKAKKRGNISTSVKTIFKDKTIKMISRVRPQYIGYPVLFRYDPKYKVTLPFYDTLPMSIILSMKTNGFLGINLHYIPWSQRIGIMEKLIKARKSGRAVKYSDLKHATAKLPYGILNFAIRRYLYTNMRTKMKLFKVNNYRDAIVNIKPMFKKESEMLVYKAILDKFKESRKKDRPLRFHTGF